MHLPWRMGAEVLACCLPSSEQMLCSHGLQWVCVWSVQLKDLRTDISQAMLCLRRSQSQLDGVHMDDGPMFITQAGL